MENERQSEFRILNSTENLAGEKTDVGQSLKDIAIGNLTIRETEAFAFFAVYARYEYAAKVCGLVHQGPPPRDLIINPQTVADNVREQFVRQMDENPPLRHAVDYFEANAPQKQVWDGRGAAWVTPQYQGADSLKKLLLHLAQARNNLFHGGKGWKPDLREIERDNDLIRYGLTILEAVIRSNDNLLHEFSSYE
ncbi:hypothetical protein FHW77_005445 [Agrobacterium sp. RC10-4-1]|uniref:hypothetical protein n=1 Tax=Agrobacterium sp. RC10-4-1 TaxID=2587039 RepID=UPI000DD683AF|nr:hypothetical protein [Agrobacterium sp. RC10-4-1]MBA8801688.1 hypothetical protein [Agrobacterium sp. RC10-4-1]